MSQRHVLQLSGATAFGGGILTFVGNIFHPREPGQLDSAANLFAVVIRDPMWTVDHFVIAIGLVGLAAAGIQVMSGASWLASTCCFRLRRSGSRCG